MAASGNLKLSPHVVDNLKIQITYVMFKWARIVLVVERGVDPKSRLENQVLYSQPMVDGRRAFMLRQQQSVNKKLAGI